jgi:hypothetical protein
MKVALVLFAAAAAVMAQSVDTVSATQSGVCEPHNDHWLGYLLVYLSDRTDNHQALPRRRR